MTLFNLHICVNVLAFMREFKIFEFVLCFENPIWFLSTLIIIWNLPCKTNDTGHWEPKRLKKKPRESVQPDAILCDHLHSLIWDEEMRLREITNLLNFIPKASEWYSCIYPRLRYLSLKPTIFSIISFPSFSHPCIIFITVFISVHLLCLLDNCALDSFREANPMLSLS